jgi:pimeloyl-ACP methyl ester carboxylesterase
MRRQKQGFVKGSDDTDIFYESFGEGLPLAFADGIGCFGYAWKYLWDYFGDSCRLLHFHYRGHGQSAIPKDQNYLTIQDHCDDLVRVFDADGVDKAVLVGHSMGCQVIFEFYRMYPDRVAGLIPICGSYGRPLTTFNDSDTLDKIFPLIYTFAVLTPWMATPVWKWLTPTRLGFEIAKLTEVNRHLIKKDDFMPYLEDISSVPINIFAKMLDHAAQHTAEDMLTSILVPTLIVAAERDGFTPMWLSNKMCDAIPDAEMIVLPTGTHTGPIELPELVNLRVEKFLREHLGHAGVRPGVRSA